MLPTQKSEEQNIGVIHVNSKGKVQNEGALIRDGGKTNTEKGKGRVI